MKYEIFFRILIIVSMMQHVSYASEQNKDTIYSYVVEALPSKKDFLAQATAKYISANNIKDLASIKVRLQASPKGIEHKSRYRLELSHPLVKNAYFNIEEIDR
jgi:hypothetical protein